MRSFVAIASLIVCCSVLCGCAAVRQVSGPEPIPLTDEDRKALTADAQVGVTHKSFVDETDETRRRKIRDNFVFSRLALTDLEFIAYVRRLSGNRRNLESATEASQMTLSIWGTLADSVQAKANLAAAVAMITGLKSNVDKNYFDNKGTDAILSMMSARRKEILARIVRSMDLDSSAYTFLSAKVDVDEYYQAGTMEGAFLVIQADASKRDTAAQATLKGQQLVRNIQANLGAPAQADKRQLTRSLDPQSVSLGAATKALLELGIAKADLPETIDAALDILQEAVRNARTPEQVAHVKKVFVDSGITLK